MGFEPVLTALQAAASPLGQSTMWVYTIWVHTKRIGTGLAADSRSFERMTRFELATLTLAR